MAEAPPCLSFSEQTRVATTDKLRTIPLPGGKWIYCFIKSLETKGPTINLKSPRPAQGSQEVRVGFSGQWRCVGGLRKAQKREGMPLPCKQSRCSGETGQQGALCPHNWDKLRDAGGLLARLAPGRLPENRQAP